MSESKQEGKSSDHLLKLVKEKQREALLKKAKSQNTALQQDPTNSQKNTKVENTGNNGAEKVGAGGQADGKKSKKGNFGSKLSSGYYEYKMDDYKQNRGGYLIPNKVEDDGGVRFVKETPEVILSDRAPLVVEEVPLMNDPSENPMCCECDSLDIDYTFLKVYNEKVCNSCKQEFPEKYSLLTKTEVKQDYLLTEEELRDSEVFKVWLKPNPHSKSYSNMMLYVRKHVEDFAAKKWGSLEKLDLEFERRDIAKKQKKSEQFKKSVQELRKRTRIQEWQSSRKARFNESDKHEHVFASQGGDSSSEERKCTICGLKIQVEEF